MPDEDYSSHRSSVFTQIAEKKRMLFRQTVECRVFLLFAQKSRKFQTLTSSLYRVRGEIKVKDDNALNSS